MVPLVLGALAVTFSAAHSALASPSLHHNARDSTNHKELRARNLVTDGQISSSYDFIIVGGGVAGLTLANRLSADANKTVLVLEAGDTGEAVADQIDVPGNAYYNGLTGTSYDWQYLTTPQPNVNNRQLTWPMGKVVGGSSAINGLYLVRPSQPEVDAWSALVAQDDTTGVASAWTWDNYFAALKKSETFTAPSSSIASEADIQYNTSDHGTDGPVHYSYPGYQFPVTGNWTPTLEALNIPNTVNAYGGENWGSYVANSAINPTNWTRSYAKPNYLDPLPPRANLDVLPNAMVTRILWDSSSPSNNVSATGVEYASAAGAQTNTVSVTGEIIVTAGAVGSPHLLLVSGVGPSDVLEAAGVNVTVNLPGVGQNLQDHLSTVVTYTTDDSTAQSLLQANEANAAYMSFINSAVGYVPASVLFDNVTEFQQGAIAAMNDALVPSTDATVLAGYHAIYNITANLLATNVGQVEVLLNLMGYPSGGMNTLGVEIGIQHPFSHGRIYINSSSIFNKPLVDPGYLTNSYDLTMLIQGLRLAREIATTPPLSSAMITEISPGTQVQSDEEWQEWLVNEVGTEYHPSSGCSQMPLSLGGVVDANMRVYGLANVRVADSSIYPFAFAAHLQSPTYGLAELAAEIIRAQYNGTPLPGSNSTATNSTSPSSTSTGASPSNASSRQSAASSLSVNHFAICLAVVIIGLFSL